MARWKSKLRIRMMFSFICVSVAVVLFLEILYGSMVFLLDATRAVNANFTNFVGCFLPIALMILLITIPVGAAFSLISTRGIIYRMQRLVDATTQLASGHYAQRVQVTSKDEWGLLERQFNLLAEKLLESLEQRHMLTEENTRLAERARIFRDLHDGVKQQAFALTMQVSTAITLIDAQPETARLHLQNAETLAYQVQQELTALIQSSRPSVLSEKGLATALQEYVTTWSQQQAIPILHHIDTCTLPPLIEETLLRITQEALSNIARHSHASSVILNLSCEQDTITLILEDNGCGFDPDEPALTLKNGVGLRSMRERVEALHGILHIESKYGAGTRIVVYCPYPANAENQRETQLTVPPLLPDKKVTL